MGIFYRGQEYRNWEEFKIKNNSGNYSVKVRIEKLKDECYPIPNSLYDVGLRGNLSIEIRKRKIFLGGILSEVLPQKVFNIASKILGYNKTNKIALQDLLVAPASSEELFNTINNNPLISKTKTFFDGLSEEQREQVIKAIKVTQNRVRNTLERITKFAERTPIPIGFVYQN